MGPPMSPSLPVDGLLDTREERFAVDLSTLAPGPTSPPVRASDAAYNVTASSLRFKSSVDAAPRKSPAIRGGRRRCVS